jgi:hypothetical protein
MDFPHADARHVVELTGRVFGHVLAIAVGFILMVIGLAMGVTMVLLPVGLAIGVVGVLVFVWGLFGHLANAKF